MPSSPAKLIGRFGVDTGVGNFLGDTRIRLLETDQVALQAENESLRGAVANAEARAEQIRSSYEIKIEALNSRIRVSEQLLVQSRDEIRRLSDEQVRFSEQGREIESLQARLSEGTADSNIAQRRAEEADEIERRLNSVRTILADDQSA